MRADKVSMASSIEVRVPFLMPGLIEDESCIQDKYLVDCKKKSIFGTKVILKWICQDLFGVEFTYREKRGFGIYLMDYFSQEYVKDYIINTLLPGIKKREILDYQAINKMYKKKCKNIYRGKTVSNDQVVNALWVAFSFEMWCQYYLDGNPNNRFNMGEIIRG